MRSCTFCSYKFTAIYRDQLSVIGAYSALSLKIDIGASFSTIIFTLVRSTSLSSLLKH